MAVRVIRGMQSGLFFVLLKELEKKVGVPKPITAVAHCLSFTLYGIWKKGTLYEETFPSLCAAKRRKMAKRAEEKPEVLSLAGAVDNLINQTSNRG